MSIFSFFTFLLTILDCRSRISRDTAMWAMNFRPDINKNAICRSLIQTKRIFSSCMLFAVSKAWAFAPYIPAEDLTRFVGTQTVEKANDPFSIHWVSEDRVIFSIPAFDPDSKER